MSVSGGGGGGGWNFIYLSLDNHHMCNVYNYNVIGLLNVDFLD